MSDLSINSTEKKDEKLYLVFHVGAERYAVDVYDVNNIIMIPAITKMPGTDECYKGIIHLRGEIIPIMSLSKRLNIGKDEITKDSRIIILDLANDKRIGVIVDSVTEVITISADNIEEPSAFVSKEDSLISGIGRKDSNLISIIETNLLARLEYAS